jgi:plasmid maintenance system antidote protein VapI
MKKVRFHELFADLITKSAWSRRSMAEMVEVSHTHISNVAAGKKKMSAEMLKKIERMKFFKPQDMEALKEAWWDSQ